MPAARLYGLKNCDTCKKALKALEQAGCEAVLIDIRNDTDLPSKLPEWIAATGADALVNKRSTTWRNLDEATRARAATSEGALDVLQANPTLIKRPVIEAGHDVHVGWSSAVAAALISG